jgi:hypothetical protein
MRSAASHGIWDIIAIGLKDIVPARSKRVTGRELRTMMR